MNEERNEWTNENKTNEKMREMTDEEAAQVSGGEGDVTWRCTNPQCKFYMKTLYYTLTSKCSCGHDLEEVQGFAFYR